ncbi:hypothetical protein GHT06_017063 [Daphnia sinensis]|uniref:Uncharacterized protein n=1 Tax=Daphnia sinensis TaxID=1820382 RepID=A0AAD5L8G6_9CRUS|nr:hypothetical protein GHT06_017063 [Daphnia sinensis]
MIGTKRRGLPSTLAATHSFAIVKFHLPANTSQFDIAPLEWNKKTGNKTTCYWPNEDVAENTTALVNLITKKAVVDKENWTKFILIFHLFSDTHKGAQDQLKNAINGEQVVSTDLEKRVRGGRTEAKKRRAAVVDAVSSPSLIVKPSDSRGAASTAVCTVANYGTSDHSEAPSRHSSVNSSTERVEILGDGSSSSSALSSDEDLLISKVVGEVQHAKNRSRVSATRRHTKETAATKKTNSSSASNLPKIPKVLAALGINQMIAPRQTFIARNSLPPVNQQSAIADIQEAGSSHQQHSAGVLQNSVNENRRAEKTNGHSDAMQLYRHRTTTFHRTSSASTEIASITHDERIKLDQLMQTMLRILRGQEQIKAIQVDIKNTLAVVMHNTIPAEPELGGIKEEMCLPVKSLALFDLMNTTIRKDKIQRMKLGQNDEKRCFENTEVKQLFIESLQAAPGLRLSEHQINSKIASWLKAAPSKIGKDNGYEEEDLSGDE